MPRAVTDGVLVDLEQMNRVSDPALSRATQEIWLAPGDHTALLSRLRATGVQLLSSQRLSAATAANEAQAAPLALRLSVAVAAVGILLTLLGLIGTRIAGFPARRRDWRTVAAAGVPPSRIRRLAALDVTAPAALGAVLGVVAGCGAYLLVIAQLPVLPLGVGNPPPDWTPAYGPLALLAAVGVLLIAMIGTGVATWETRTPEAGRVQ